MLFFCSNYPLSKINVVKTITEPLMLFIFFFFFIYSLTHLLSFNLIERCDLLSLALWIYRLSI